MNLVLLARVWVVGVTVTFTVEMSCTWGSTWTVVVIVIDDVR
jgi:hypothetical protein